MSIKPPRRNESFNAEKLEDILPINDKEINKINRPRSRFAEFFPADLTIMTTDKKNH